MKVCVAPWRIWRRPWASAVRKRNGSDANLFKLRQSSGVKRLIERQWSRQDWTNVGQGFDAVEAMLKLSGWSRARRVVVMRRAVKDTLVAEEKAVGNRAKRQRSLQFAEPVQPIKLWEYAVLVTN